MGSRAVGQGDWDFLFVLSQFKCILERSQRGRYEPRGGLRRRDEVLRPRWPKQAETEKAYSPAVPCLESAKRLGAFRCGIQFVAFESSLVGAGFRPAPRRGLWAWLVQVAYMQYVLL
jgi:hypothetical protein